MRNIAIHTSIPRNITNDVERVPDYPAENLWGLTMLTRPGFYLAALLLVPALLYTHYAASEQNASLTAVQQVLAQSPEARDGIDIDQDDLKKRLYNSPLDQSALALQFQLIADDKLKAETRGRYVDAIKSTGWRASVAQQILIAEAVKKEDVKTIIERADGLMRRNNLRDELLQLLSLVEADERSSTILIDRLRHRPTWRKDFFGRVALLQSDQQLNGRIRTISQLMEQSDPINRQEIAGSSVALVRSGNHDSARDLVAQFKTTYEPDDTDFADSKFHTLARTSSAGERSLPFEWQLGDARGLSTRVAESAGQGVVRVGWNGRGTPVFLSRRLVLDTPSQIRVKLDVNASDLSRRNDLQLKAVCPDQTYILLRNKSESQKALHFESDGEVACSYPDLQIGGKAGLTRRRLDTDIDDITVTASDEGSPV